MIYEFGMKNYFGFNEPLRISFRLDKNCPEEIREGLDFTRVMCFKGANGSGKTNILRGLAFLMNFCTFSFFARTDSPIPTESFFFNRNPTEFFIKFKSNNKSYMYELELTDSEVIKEKLYNSFGKKGKILERVGDSITFRIDELATLDAIKLRKNASIISIANQYELAGLGEFYNFFNAFHTNVSYSGFRDENPDIKFVSGILHNSPDLMKFTRDFIIKCDPGISRISTHEKVLENEQKEYLVTFEHEYNHKKYGFHSIFESSGTQTLYKQLLNYKNTLDTGGVLIVDEFGSTLHPDILPELLKLFLNKATNPNNAQLIIATHDADIMDFLGRYRTYLVNKINNESIAYRLDEIPGDILRNDRPISPIYKAGKIGGVPKL